jgi:hypothetical protein
MNPINYLMPINEIAAAPTVGIYRAISTLDFQVNTVLTNLELRSGSLSFVLIHHYQALPHFPEIKRNRRFYFGSCTVLHPFPKRNRIG